MINSRGETCRVTDEYNDQRELERPQLRIETKIGVTRESSSEPSSGLSLMTY